MTSLARRRVDVLTSSVPPFGFKDRDYFSSADPSKTTLAQRIISKKKNNNSYKDLSNLVSGMATLEIADAFLQGSVGRELVTMKTQVADSDWQKNMYRQFEEGEVGGEEEEDIEMSPYLAHQKASRLLGLATDAPSVEAKSSQDDVLYSSHKFPIMPSKNSAPVPVGGGVAGKTYHTHIHTATHNVGFSTAAQSLREKAMDRMRTAEARKLYTAPGWELKKGGWVAEGGVGEGEDRKRGAGNRVEGRGSVGCDELR
jgi:hypothetical protein